MAVDLGKEEQTGKKEEDREECAGRGAVWTASMPSFIVEEGSARFKKITHVLL